MRRRGNKLGRLPVAEGDGAGLVEQKDIHVASRLDGAAAHGEDVALEQTVHAGDADGAQQTADGRRDQTDQQRDQHGHGENGGGINAEGLEREADQQKITVSAGEQNGQRDFVGVFWRARLRPARSCGRESLRPD